MTFLHGSLGSLHGNPLKALQRSETVLKVKLKKAAQHSHPWLQFFFKVRLTLRPTQTFGALPAHSQPRTWIMSAVFSRFGHCFLNVLCWDLLHQRKGTRRWVPCLWPSWGALLAQPGALGLATPPEPVPGVPFFWSTSLLSSHSNSLSVRKGEW